jgi:hypothetical protein
VCKFDPKFEAADQTDGKCEKATEKTEDKDAKKAAGAVCTKADECVKDYSCGALDKVEGKTCIKTDTCGTKVGEVELKCLSAIRNAASVAVAAIAIAYSL